VNLAYRDVRHNLGRFIVTCLGLSLLLGVVLAMIGIYRGLIADAMELVDTMSADIWVVEKGTRGPFAESSRIPLDTRDAIARIHGVEQVGAITFQSIETQYSGSKLRLYVIGYKPGQLGGPKFITTGRGLTNRNFEAVADIRTRLSSGDHIQLGRNNFTIVGMTNNAVSSGGEPAIYLSLEDAQKLQFDLSPSAIRRERARGAVTTSSTATVSAVIARTAPNASAEHIASVIRRWKHLSAMTQEEQGLILTRSVVEKARKQIGMFTSILIVVSAVVIALIIHTMTMDKIREIATLKLIGAPDRVIIGLIVQQALAMGLIGFGLGALLISGVKDSFPKRLILQPYDGLGLAGIVIIICLLASVYGVYTALKVDPAEALAG
jgi:putative ABC transport system permease protein